MRMAMRHLLKLFGACAVAALTLAACSRIEPDMPEPAGAEPAGAEPTHRVLFHTDESPDDTRTSIQEGGEKAAFRWSADDAARFHVFENGVDGTGLEISSSDSYQTITLGANFEGSPVGPYIYTAFLAAHRSQNGDPAIPAVQTSTNTSFDPDADVLFAPAQYFAEQQDNISLRFARPVVISKMTLKGLTEGETLSEITLRSDVDLTGSFDLSEELWTGEGREITINTEQVVPANGEVTVFFVTMPVEDATLTLTATTDGAVYSKTFARPISFAANTVKVFGVSGMTRTPVAVPKVYTLEFSNITNAVSSYTATWSQTCGGFTWSLANFNNNNKQWSFVRCGRKNDASTATITTSTTIPEAIGTVDLDITSIAADKVTSITLYVDGSSEFNSASLQTIAGSLTTGIQHFTIPNPTPNSYYRLSFVCIAGGSNGLVEVNSVTYHEGSANPLPTVTSVTSSAASSVTQTTALLSGSFSGASGTILETGFYWGTSPESQPNELYVSTGVAPSGNFSTTLTGLDEATTYYFRAYVLELRPGEADAEYHYGSVLSFTTRSAGSGDLSALSFYEIPAIPNLNGTVTSDFFEERDDLWSRYYTTNAQQQVALHTFTHPTSGERVRTYTVLYDESNYAPLWTAHAMHSSMWPDKNVGRNGSWISDPAISLTQQDGLDNANSVGYSRGHFVASNYRQSTVKENKQTFYLSNQAPQWQDNFNSGMWSSLEEAVAAHAPSGRDTLYVVTGVLYEGSIQTKPASGLNVPIPSHFYKCLMLCSFDGGGNMTLASGCAYVYTNKSHSGEQYSSGLTSIDSIEERAGFDFFPNVPAALQTTAESQAISLW